jgi:hypothetical protein
MSTVQPVSTVARIRYRIVSAAPRAVAQPGYGFHVTPARRTPRSDLSPAGQIGLRLQLRYGRPLPPRASICIQQAVSHPPCRTWFKTDLLTESDDPSALLIRGRQWNTDGYALWHVSLPTPSRLMRVTPAEREGIRNQIRERGTLGVHWLLYPAHRTPCGLVLGDPGADLDGGYCAVDLSGEQIVQLQRGKNEWRTRHRVGIAPAYAEIIPEGSLLYATQNGLLVEKDGAVVAVVAWIVTPDREAAA